MGSDQDIRTVQVFVSSPGDVMSERERIDLVARRLNEAFADLVRIKTVLWERKIYGSHDGFQAQIPPAEKADLVIAIFWARLGSPLPGEFARMENGERYPSGTAYEVLTAIDARRKADRPDVYVFRKTETVSAASDEAKAQHKDLDAFFLRWFQAPDGQYLRAYQRFANADEFEQQVERLLRQWIAERVPRNSGVIWPIETEGSPFRGLLPFDAKHAAIYFGRDRKVTRAIEQLQSVARPHSDIRSAPRNVPFLLIVGESGAGKSSLMRAGLAPRLTAPGVVPTVDVWRTAVARIGDDADPFMTLAKALFVENDDKGGFGAALPELADSDDATPEKFVALFTQDGAIGERESAPAIAPILATLTTIQTEEMRQRQSKRDLCANLLLLVDQLENIFSSGITEDQRSAFARLLFALSATRRVWVVATLRSDIYPRLITPGAFLALKDAGSSYDLAAPGESELTEIVGKSAAAAGLVYEQDAKTGERLDDRILHDAQGENMLPLLQFALQRLFEKRVVVRVGEAHGGPDGTPAQEEVRLTFDAYETMKGLDGAIDETAKAALGKLGPAEIAALPRLLRCLAVPVHDRKAAATATSGLTVRMVTRAVAVPDEPTARLVDALIGARIVVATDDLIGIAHQRVFESWEDARNIIADHRDFFRIREEVDNQFRRWDGNQRPKALLLAKGLPLAEAQQIVKQHGDELSPAIRDYVAASSRRAQLFNVIVGTAAAVFFALFVISTTLGIMTRSAQQTATANYQAAKGALGDLISLITDGLRDTKGIEIATVRKVLSLVDQTITKVQKVSDGDPELSAIRANMLYQSGKMFQKKLETAAALQAANESFAIFSRLTVYDKRTTAPATFAAVPAPRRWELALSIELVGDLAREQKKFPDARARFEDALAVVNQLVAEVPGNDEWAQGVSQLYTRIGDLDIAADLAAAERDYGSSMAVAAKYFQHKPTDESWQRELAWPYAKLADVGQKKADADKDANSRATDYSTALDDLENSLCLRREVAARDSAKTEFTRDVSYTLGRIGVVKDRLNDADGAELAFFESLEIRRSLANSVTDNALYLGDVATSLQSIGNHYRDLGNAKSALAFYDNAVAIRDKIVSLSPADQQAQQNAADAHKAADGLRAQAPAASAAGSPSGAWWLKIVGDAETAAEAKLLATLGADPSACMVKVQASVDREIDSLMTTATVR
jgi:tetratricopeptide (TPR) repeat protein